MTNGKEYILCCSIWYKTDNTKVEWLPKNIDKGIVFSGHRHYNCISQAMSVLYKNWKDEENEEHKKIKKHFIKNHVEGFLTSENRFVDTKEAAIVALESGQIKRLKIFRRELSSEDLY